MTENIELYVVEVSYVTRWVNGTKYADALVFGRCADGNSVCVRVQGVDAWFRLKRFECGEDPVEALRCALEPYTADRKVGGRFNSAFGATIRVEEDRATAAYYYNPEPVDMLKVSVSHPGAVTPLRTALWNDRVTYNGVAIPGILYDCHIEYAIRFMIDSGIRCGMWMSVIPVEREAGFTTCSSPDVLCSIGEVTPLPDKTDAAPQRLLSFDIECKWGRKGEFPHPENPDCAVFQIACEITIMDGRPIEEINATRVRTMLCLRKTDSFADDVTMMCFEEETDLLEAFAEYVRKSDPDVITGWNSNSFDFWYIIERVKALGASDDARCFSRITGRIIDNSVENRISKGKGFTADNKLDIPGRVPFDMLIAVRNGMEKHHSYQLNAIAKHYLGDKKDDVPYRVMNAWFDKDAEHRSRIAKYCMQDAALPRRLLLKLASYVAYSEQARLCCVPPTFLFTRGETIKAYAGECSKAYAWNYAMDYRPPPEGTQEKYKGAKVLAPIPGFYKDDVAVATLDFNSLYPNIIIAHNLCNSTLLRRGDPRAAQMIADGTANEGEDGAVFVQAATRKGLIPSILENLLNSRRAVKREMAQTTGFHKTVLDCRQLALKVVANSMYGAKGAIKYRFACREVSTSTTGFGRKMIDQTAKRCMEIGPPGTKVIYGDTDSVFVHLVIPPEDGLDAEAQIDRKMHKAFEVAADMTEELNKLYRAPNKLELEKIFETFLQTPKKKRYAGRKYVMVESKLIYLGVSVSGFELVRRDNCALVRKAQTDILYTLLNDKVPEFAIGIAQELVRAMVHDDIMKPPPEETPVCTACTGKIKTTRYSCGEGCEGDYCAKCYTQHTLAAPIHEHTLVQVITRDDFVISKSFSKPIAEYASPQPHGIVMTRMEQRRSSDPSDEIAGAAQYYPGERVPYYYVAPCLTHPETEVLAKPRAGTKAAQKSTPTWKMPGSAVRAEDPVWGFAHDLFPDVLYYIENQALKPIVRVVEALVGGEAETIRRICAPMKGIGRPKRGISSNRHIPEVRDALYGVTGIKRKASVKAAEIARIGERGKLTSFFAPKKAREADDVP